MAHKVGRPTLLDAVVADRLVALLAGGATVAEAAAAIDVAPRTIQHWRRRAWSRRPEDEPYIDLERRLVAAVALREREDEPLPTWEAVAAELELADPARW